MRKTLPSGPIETAQRPLLEAAAGSVWTEAPLTAVGLEAQLAELERLADDAADRSASNGSLTPDSDAGLKSDVSSLRAASDPLVLKPGALLIREWQGRIERVMVVKGGFAWNGAAYTSLSAAAFAITGTKWNGHRFFGVRRRDRTRTSERGDAKRSNGGEGSSALACGKADNRSPAARISSLPSV